ncbi:MAG: LruC domain-containing protein [Bacteroidales bacterium]|nr:LruC domain-containing protein [Bacteroidales bacterium]
MKFDKHWFSRSPLIPVLILIPVFFGACKKTEENNSSSATIKPIDQLIIADNFSWSTIHQVSFSVVARDNADNPLPNVRFKVYSASSDSGGVYLFSGITDNSGSWTGTQPLPIYLNKVTVTNNYLGLIREQVFPVLDNKVSGIFGGKVPDPVSFKSAGEIIPSLLPGVYYMGSFHGKGVPDYLVSPNDPVDADLLNDLNASLPEYQSVPVYHPEYLANTVPDNLELTELCDVWATYITEGATWKNSIGFFVFDTNNPPDSPSAIDSIKVVFPNMSNSGSGGGLDPGNKVYLGRYPSGKSIGWVVFANGWDGSQITNGKYRIYSIPSLNPEPNPTLQKHMILLRDVGRHAILFGFEDWRRDQKSDQDFNDGILYVKANPVTAINTDGMPDISTTQPDEDGDGIPDEFDDYDADPSLAFDNYYPDETGYSSLAFEDLYPGQGDYDFNDLVISYRFNQITNAQNKVALVKVTLITEAVGATFHNAFAFQIPIPPEMIQNVTGTDLRHGFISVSANGTEAGQTKAVIIVYDDALDQLPPPGHGVGTNTEHGAPYVIPDTLELIINFVQPVSLAEIGSPPYNPFIIVDRNRNREVHLPDYPPTDLVDGTDFGTFSDDSKPDIGRYYKTRKNLPWAINISDKFSYMFEKEAINTGYLYFNDWAESNGALYTDWYFNTVTGYRDNSKIYSH